MKRNNITKSFLSLALSASLLTGSGLTAFAVEAPELTFEKNYEFQTSTQTDDGSEYFETTIEQEGKIYTLLKIETEVLKEESVKGEYLFYDSPAFIDADKVEKPKEILEQGGKTYLLKDSVLQSAEIQDRTQYVESEVKLDEWEWLDNVPKTQEIEVTDNSTGQVLITTMPFIKVESQEKKWVDTFSFPITISGYDADSFMLGNTKISKSDDLMNYEDEFLSYLGLSSDKYKISKIEWNGEAFTQNGTLCRTATASGQKLVYDIVAVYGGEATLPAADGYLYHCTYVNEDNPDSTIYTMNAKATYSYIQTKTTEDEEQGFFQNLLEWIKANPIASFGIGTMIIILFVLFIMFLMAKKKDKKDDNRVDIVDIK